jgi:hypothetical protein
MNDNTGYNTLFHFGTDNCAGAFEVGRNGVNGNIFFAYWGQLNIKQVVSTDIPFDGLSNAHLALVISPIEPVQLFLNGLLMFTTSFKALIPLSSNMMYILIGSDIQNRSFKGSINEFSKYSNVQLFLLKDRFLYFIIIVIIAIRNLGRFYVFS